MGHKALHVHQWHPPNMRQIHNYDSVEYTSIDADVALISFKITFS